MNAHITRYIRKGGIAVAVLAALAVAVMCGVTMWLTPERLTRIVNEEASARLDADVKASNVRFTFWSTFPRLMLETDSISVYSRTLDSVSPALRSALPPDAGFLLSASHAAGGINLLKLIDGQLWLRDVEVDSLRVNLVAVTDSLNNYDIVPGGGEGRIPYFRIEDMRMVRGGEISYTSVPAATHARIMLSEATLAPHGKRDTYGMRLLGEISAHGGGVTLPDSLPFLMEGDVRVRFRPFGISTTGYDVRLGDIRGHVSMDIDMDRGIRFNRLACRVEDLTLENLLRMLPEGEYPVLSRIDAGLSFDATARLTAPYSFQSGGAPSAEVIFDVPDGEVSYTVSDREHYTVSHVGLGGRLVFDGADPSRSYFDLSRCRLSGLGVDAGLHARITDLDRNPVVSAEIEGRGDLEALAESIKALRGHGLEGDMEFNARLRFRLHDDILYGSLVSLRTRSRHLRFGYGPCRVSLRGFRASTTESHASALSSPALRRDVPVDLTLDADGVRVSDPRDSLAFDGASLHARLHLGRQSSGPVMRQAKASVVCKDVSMRLSGARMRLQDVGLELDARRMARPVDAEPFAVPASWNSDARTLGFAAHTPQYLLVKAPERLRRIMRRWQVGLAVGIGRGDLRMPSYPAENSISGLDLTASFDSVVIRHVAFASGDTRGEMSARVGNLRQFLASPGPAPLDVGLDLRLDTVQINQLARAYTAGHPGSAIARGDKEGMAAGTDTVAVLVPRNLSARINASAKQTRYINLHLYDLVAGVSIADGRVDVDTLRLSSDFGAASMRYSYDTSDMQEMKMSASADIENINVVRFFKNFHRLLEMMPEMKNLSGDVTAQASGHVRVFPDMYVNVPSAWADISVQGRGLRVRQNRFIRHVTRMLMIPDDGTLDIDNLDVHAGVHANLLEVFPFTFSMSRYRLVMGGLNNFNGDMYYHIGVEKWPLRIPFGINIKGHYRHPVLRFGGKDWHDGNGAEITSDVMDYNKLNIIRETRRYIGEFVHTAATYEGD